MTAPLRYTPGIIAWPLDGSLTVRIAHDPPPPSSAPVLARWEQMCRENPRHYDGPVLSVVTFDPDRAEVLCRRDRYQRLAVQPQVPTGVHQLAVTAIITATDGGGRRYVLLGRRSPETRVHGHMWELGPSGGVSPPPLSIQSMSTADLLRHLADEVSEEVGLELPAGAAVAMVRDLPACSDDVAFMCDLGALEPIRPRTGAANWEYTETFWLPIDSVAQFDATNGDEIIGAARALFRVLGWIDET